MKYYIATKLERADEHKKLSAELNALGHEVSYDWTEHGSVQEETVERMAEVAASEVRGVVGADLVVVLLPGGRGTHTEFGLALACAEQEQTRRRNKAHVDSERRKVVVIGDVNDLGGRSHTCVFYQHPLVHHFDTSAEFVAFMRGIRKSSEWM